MKTTNLLTAAELKALPKGTVLVTVMDEVRVVGRDVLSLDVRGGMTAYSVVTSAVAELKAECKRRGLKVSGTKAQLVDRLMVWDVVEIEEVYDAIVEAA